MHEPTQKPRRAEFNYRRWAALFLLAFVVLLAYQTAPYVRCSYRVADEYQLGQSEIDPSDPDYAMEEYRLGRQEYADQTAGSGGFLAALQLGLKQCWGVVGLGYGHSPYWMWVMFGCLGLSFVLWFYGRLRRPRWKADLRNRR